MIAIWVGRDPRRGREEVETQNIVSIKRLKKAARELTDKEWDNVEDIKDEGDLEKEATKFSGRVNGLLRQARVKLKKGKNNTKGILIEQLELCGSEVLKHKDVQKKLNTMVALMKTGVKEGGGAAPETEKLAEKLEEKLKKLNPGNKEVAEEAVDKVFANAPQLEVKWETNSKKFKTLLMKTSRLGAIDYMGCSLKMTNAIFGVSKVARNRFRVIAEAALRLGYFPEVWKRDNIIFLYKNKGDRMDTGNWRLITIAPSLGKHLEKVMCYAMSGFDDRNQDL